MPTGRRFSRRVADDKVYRFVRPRGAQSSEVAELRQPTRPVRIQSRLDRRCLLVIDDAWRVQDPAPLLHRRPMDQTTRLVTTRDDAALPRDAVRVRVDAMTVGQSETMLARDDDTHARGRPVATAAPVRLPR